VTALARDTTDLDGRRFDLAIIGGGITGSGVARHAAAAGLNTLLLEAGDFAGGTSSRSTKLIHGGLRYLAMGDFGLVREGARERKNLFRIAPHLSQPKTMVVPAASRAGLLKLRIGISAYEWLGAVVDADQHDNWYRGDLAEHEPLLDRQRFPYACAYREYLTDDARLVLGALRAAVAAGARVVNYAAVTRWRRLDHGIRLQVRDALAGGDFTVDADAVVNATGPWVEQFLALADGGGAVPSRLHLSKGVHLIFPRERLALNNMVMMTNDDQRPVFAIPRGSVTYVGTTDTSFERGPQLWPEVDPADVAYLLRPLARYFGGARLTAADLVGSWAGLRPLIAEAGKSSKEISRRDEVWRDGRMLTVAGGKLTGFRLMAEETLQAVAEVLGRPIGMPDPLARLPGGDFDDLAALQADLGRRYQADERTAERLARLYGSEATRVLGERPTPIAASVYAEEVRWAVREESAVHLEDLLYRRLRVPWFLPEQVDEVLEQGGELMAALLGWSPEVLAEERRAARTRLALDRFDEEPPALAS